MIDHRRYLQSRGGPSGQDLPACLVGLGRPTDWRGWPPNLLRYVDELELRLLTESRIVDEIRALERDANYHGTRTAAAALVAVRKLLKEWEGSPTAEILRDRIEEITGWR